MMPKIEASKYESKPVKIGLPITFEPLIYPHDFLKSHDFYFADTSTASDASRRRTIDVNCGIVREDFGICQGTQENYASGGYSPGPLSPRHESSVVYFQDLVRAALGA
jgi:hypothetical protein